MKNKYEYIIRNLYKRDLRSFVDYETMLNKERAKDVNFWQVVEKKLQSERELKKWFWLLYRRISNGNAVARVAEINGKIVGLCTVMGQNKWRETSHVGELGVDILKEYRHAGLGSALMAEVIKAGEKRFEIVECNVFSTNKHAIRLYNKFDFKKCGKWPMHIKRKGKYIDSILMYLKY